ncbi:tellurite resistance TerB family protein [Rhodobacter sp. NTK016B]|uniref:tellurite resistance TerB family protein n=1 Tax=Rhodobacter sp. NTK016B TaxID=2759676 RepID=UPI001A8F6B6F|nr:tellurite resistance TerB family protein [Rhodobacter sp. NTK016B]MBN8290834.1 tellurite resistance TerB family protein [Rhodobacter sp. NTK016B]
MFDARRLLDQVMNSAQGGDLSRMARDLTGGAGNAGLPEAASGTAPQAPSGNSQLWKGAAAGGLVGLLIGNKKSRKMLGKGAGTALKLGGLAAVGALAYTAWQRHKGAQDGAQGASRTAQLQAPPADSTFAPERTPAGAETLARGVIVAMIQGAKADGHVDAQEQQRIFGHIETLDLSPDAKAFVMDELAAPQDPARVTAFASSPEVAAELYAASLLAMDPDTPEERAYLDQLAHSLRLEQGLVREIEATVESGV